MGRALMIEMRRARHAESGLSEPMSLQEIGKALGLSSERCRQIEVIALRKVAAALAERGLTLDDLVGDERPASGLRGRRIHRSE